MTDHHPKYFKIQLNNGLNNALLYSAQLRALDLRIAALIKKHKLHYICKC